MPLTCNIDARGKRARLIFGLVLVLTAVLLAFVWAMPAGGAVPWVVVASCGIGGGFVLFEARAGWCAVRAMGFRTRI
jgi:hypothetical protein